MEDVAHPEAVTASLEGADGNLAGQRDRPGRVAGESVTARGAGEPKGGVGEVATGPRKTCGPTRP